MSTESTTRPCRRVLIVEDNPDGRESLRTILRIWGFEVQTAENGQQGVEVAVAWHPDCAVVDINLPIFNGYEVARQVRIALGTDVLLVALTAHGLAEDRRTAFQAGFNAHLTKPADLETLACLLGGRSIAATADRVATSGHLS